MPGNPDGLGWQEPTEVGERTRLLGLYPSPGTPGGPGPTPGGPDPIRLIRSLSTFSWNVRVVLSARKAHRRPSDSKPGCVATPTATRPTT